MKIVLTGLILCISVTISQSQQAVALWTGSAPLSMGNADKDIPMIIPYPADAATANGAAVVICPGGGYATLAMDHEGVQVAAWLNSLGISAFIVKYRTGKWDEGGYRHPAPFLDGQRAIRWVRYHAENYSVDPSRVGVLGFSAGGHLASTLGTHPSTYPEYDRDDVDKQRSGPDFMILAYPVITFTAEFTHEGSKRFLLGEDPDPDLVRSLSNELTISEATPPAFLVHTTKDKAVPPENSIVFYQGLISKGIEAELHIFRRGKHGLGLGDTDYPFSSWPNLCEDWMRDLEIIK